MKRKIKILWLLIWILTAVVFLMFYKFKEINQEWEVTAAQLEVRATEEVECWQERYALEHHEVTQLRANIEKNKWGIEGK